MGNKKGRSGRPGLISETEHEIIKIMDNRKKLVQEKENLLSKNLKIKQDKKRIKEITDQLNRASKRFSDIQSKLLIRLEESRKDLQVILQSPSLVDLRARYAKFFRKPLSYDEYQNLSIIGLFDELNVPKAVEFDGTESIPDYSRWRIHEKRDKDVRKYWLSVDEEIKSTVRDTYEPEYSITGIKGVWNRIADHSYSKGSKEVSRILEKIDVREILIQALDLEKRFQNKILKDELPQILPKNEDESLEIVEIRNKIRVFEKKRIKIRTLESKPKKIRHSSLEPKIKTKNEIAKKINKKLMEDIVKMVKESNRIWEPYGIKITKVPIEKIQFVLD